MVRPSMLARGVVGVAMLLLAGCGGGAEEPQPGDPSDPTSAATPSASASASPTPSVPVASGPVLKMPSAQVTMPARWERLEQLIPATVAAGDPDGFASITLAEVDSFDDSTNDELARIALDLSPYGNEVKQVDDVEVGGVAMYRLVNKGRTRSFRDGTYEELGTVHDDQVVKLIFNLDRNHPAAERQEIRDQVLASFTWR